MQKLRNHFETAARVLLIALIAVLLGIMTVQVGLRYIFGSSLIWAEEVCRYLLIWISFLAVVFAYERGEMASVPILREALPRRAGLALAILANICGIVLLLVLIRYGLIYADRMGSSPIPAARLVFGDGPGIPPMYWIYVALPVGLSMLAVRLLVDIFLYLGMMRRPGATAASLRDRDVIGGHQP